MIDMLIIGTIMWVAIFLFMVATGSNLFMVMVAEQLRYLDLITMYAPLPPPAPPRTLPEPVERYISWAGGHSTDRPVCTHIRFQGRIRFGKTGRWLRMEGRGAFAFAVPAFVWHTTITYAPGVWLEEFEYYVHQNAGVRLNLFSFFPLNNSHDREIQAPSLFRYLAATPFFPQLAAASRGLVWEPIDEMAAMVAIHDAGLSVEALVRFDGKGRIERITAKYPSNPAARHRLAGLFTCQLSDYSEADGSQVPRQMVLEQILPDGEYICAEISVSQVKYDVRGTAREPDPS